MKDFNVLISSAGRRVALLRIFRQTLRDLNLSGQVFAVDASKISAAFHDADEGWLVPRCTSPEFSDRVLEICRRNRIRLIVPTIDTELPVYAAHQAEFARAGIAVAISSPEVVAIGGDKVQTHDWLVAHGFPTVAQASPLEVLSASAMWEFPLIAKPRFGSASIGVQKIADRRELELAAQREGLVVQSIAPGVEYTVDLLITRQGKCVCAVPRKRLEVRAGEVSKGMTVRRDDLIGLACRLAETLPGAYGVLNMQVFLDSTNGTANVIEINPRFGGGFPLTWEAGGLYPRWMIEEILQLPNTASAEHWKDRLVMLRYDDAIFVSADSAGV
jgi:carbamoyl-phosphate synthase large subunit